MGDAEPSRKRRLSVSLGSEGITMLLKAIYHDVRLFSAVLYLHALGWREILPGRWMNSRASCQHSYTFEQALRISWRTLL